MAEYANFFTILALVAMLFWQVIIIAKTDREHEKVRAQLAEELISVKSRLLAENDHNNRLVSQYQSQIGGAQAEIRALKSKIFYANNRPIRVCEACATYPCKCE